MKDAKLNLDNVREFISSSLTKSQSTNIKNEQLKIGAELELFPYTLSPNNNISQVNLYNKPNALVSELQRASKNYGSILTESIPSNSNKTKVVKGDKILNKNGSSILFEPGGQVEICTLPCSNLADLEKQLLFNQTILKDVALDNRISFLQTGYHNLINSGGLTNQLKKPRYIALENYLSKIGVYGRKMMLKTCSMHLNFEIGVDDDTRAKRIIASNLLVPFSTSIFANSPYKKVNGQMPFKSYRSYIWQNLDNTRTGILNLDVALKTLSIDDIIDAYLEFALQAPIIYIPETGAKVYSQSMTLKHWINNKIDGISLKSSHLKNHFSLLFPEVRLRGYLELRSIDAPPLYWQMVPALFYSGLLYNEVNLNKTINLLRPHYKNYQKIYKDACYGYKSDVIYELSKKLMDLALDGYSSLPQYYKCDKLFDKLLMFNDVFLKDRKTFDDIVQL